jgi:WD40 repeat protein
MMSPIGKRFPFTDVIVAPEVGAVPVKFDPVVLDDANEVLYGVDLATGELIGQSASGDGTVTMRGTVPVGVDLVQLVVGPSSDVYGVVAGGGVYRWSHLLGGEPSIVPLQSVRSLSAAGDLLVAELGQQVLDALGRPAPNAGSAADLHLLMVDGLDYRPVVEGMSDGEPTVPGSLVVSPDDRYLAAIAEGDGFEQSVLVWDMRTTRRLATLPMSQPYQVMWASNDRFAVASARGIDQFQVVPRSVDVVVDADQLAMAGDGSAVAVTAADAADVPLVVRGALSAQGAVPGSYQGRPNGVVALDRHGAFVASTVFDDALNVVVHRVADGKEVARFEDASAAAFVADADVLAVATFEGVDLIDATDWTVVDQIPLPDGIDGVSDLRWAADGRHLLMLGYEFETNRVLWLDTDGGVSTSITSVDASAIAVAPSATMAAVGDLAGEVRLFSLGNGARDQPPSASFVASSTVISGLGFSPDGRRLVVSSQNSTTVWDVSDPVAPRRLQVVTSLPRWSFRRATGQQLGGVTADPVGDGEWGYVAFRPDGRSFVMAGSSGMVEVPDFDPQLACSLASQRDLEAVATILDAPSACLRVPGLTN